MDGDGEFLTDDTVQKMVAQPVGEERIIDDGKFFMQVVARRENQNTRRSFIFTLSRRSGESRVEGKRLLPACPYMMCITRVRF